MANSYKYVDMLDVSIHKGHAKVQRMLKEYNKEFDNGSRETNLASLIAKLTELNEILEVEE